MSDHSEPMREQVCSPETVRDFCIETLKPAADRLYGGDFSESVLGHRASSVVIRNGLKIYFDAVCELDHAVEDGETVVYAVQTLYIYIGVLVVEKGIREHLIDAHTIAKLEDMLKAAVSTELSNEGEVPLASEADADDEIDYTSTQAWLYLRLVFDYVDGMLCEASRHHALDTYDDYEITREELQLALDETDMVDPDGEGVISRKEFERLQSAAQYIGQ